MLQVGLFLSRFLLSLWIISVSAFLFLLLPNAPNVPDNAPFASVSISAESNSTIYLPNRIFNCKETGQQFQCQTEIQGRLLELNFIKGSDYKYFLGTCRAQYDGKSISCQEAGSNYAPILAKIYKITDLGLSPQQLQQVEQEYWGINFLMQLGETRLLQIATGLSLGAGIIGAFFTWLHPGRFSKIFASFACGFGIYHLVWRSRGGVSYDIVKPYGFTPDTWGWAVDGSAIAAAVITTLTTALLFWRRLNRLTQIPIGISSGVAIFNLCWLSLTRSFLFGLDATGIFSPHRSGLIWFSTVISTVFAIAAAILLWSHTNQSIKKFLSICNGFGAIALAMNVFVLILLGLGYAD